MLRFAVVGILVGSSAGHAAELQPHRAVYDLELSRADLGASVAQVRGRYVYDLHGSACAGFALETRLVTDIVDREGKATLSDMRTTSTEDAAATRMRFASTQFLNKAAADIVAGDAARSDADIAVTLVKPQATTLQLPRGAMFPVQHSQAVLAAAAAGKSRVLTDFYDGSEKGAKVYATATAIGRETSAPPPEGGLGAGLDGLRSWPISIGYFETTPRATGEGLPAYEIHLRLYENGVSRALSIDYGAFTLSGTLVALEMARPAPCPAN